MQMLAGISLICVLCIGHTYGQEEEFLGLLDFDTFGLDLKNDGDIFKEDAELKLSDRLTEEAIKRLCDEYDIFLDSESIDCSKLRLVQKSLKVDHTIRKRQAEDPQLEGSGDGEGDNLEPELNPLSEGEAPPPGPEEDLPKEGEPPLPPNGAPEEGELPVPLNEEKEYPPPPEDLPGEGGVPPEPTELPPPPEDLPAEGDLPPPPPEPSELPPPPEGDLPPPPPEDAQKEVEGTEAPEHPNIVVEGELPVTPEVESNPVPSEPPPTEAVKEAEAPEAPGPAVDVTPGAEVTVPLVKKGRVLRPDQAAAAAPEEPETPKEPELIHEHQSGNAVVDGVDGGTIHQDEEKVKSMATNANIKTGASGPEEPKSGESAKPPQEARKDTKVLIILFVGVVVIGAAAFTYNFIKKRKQKKDQAETREENGDGNVVKRSLQNLSGQTNGDPEQGTELKPLMKKDGEKPVVAEYTDEKDSVKVEGGK